MLWQLFEEQEKGVANSDWVGWETYNNALQALAKGKGKGKAQKKKGDTKGGKHQQGGTGASTPGKTPPHGALPEYITDHMRSRSRLRDLL